jgi:hypothetical protein
MATYTELHYVTVDEHGEEAQSDEITVDDVRGLIADGTITAATKVWQDGMDDWIQIGTCAALFGLQDVFDGEGVPPQLEALHYAYVGEDGEEAQVRENFASLAPLLLQTVNSCHLPCADNFATCGWLTSSPTRSQPRRSRSSSRPGPSTLRPKCGRTAWMTGSRWQIALTDSG